MEIRGQIRSYLAENFRVPRKILRIIVQKTTGSSLAELRYRWKDGDE
jgi:hypothetical protein